MRSSAAVAEDSGGPHGRTLTTTGSTLATSAITPELADTLGATPVAQHPTGRTQIGRYRIVRRLGEGGMGVVWEANDPELGRGVAIKVLHDARIRSAYLAERLRREAQALARLHHPNVVAVYDVGVDDGELYIVMQLIAGTTLDRAIATQPAREVIDLVVRAGRGLAAAHAAGIVHRDFKPTNVLVDADGTPRVTDFGLARASDASEIETEAASESALATSLSRGELVGTPAYMAPEQFLGGPVTPATDQFAFCVTLWEALAGARPFAGRDVASLREVVTRGQCSEPPAVIPRRIRAALLRGLAVDPADRFPSMTALLEELAPPRRPRRLALAALAALAAVLVVVLMRPAAVDACAGVTAPAAATWNDGQRETVRTALGARAARVIAMLDARTQRWSATRLDACRATHVQHVQSPAELDEREACLDRVLAEHRATIELLSAKPEPGVLARAYDIVAQMHQPEQCTRAAAVTFLATRTTTAQPAPQLRDKIARLRAAHAAGKYRDVTTTAPALVQDVTAAGEPAVLADVLFVLGQAQYSVGDLAGARTSLRASAEAALRARSDREAVRAWTELATVTAQIGDLDGVEDALAAARGAHARIDATDPTPAVWLELASSRVALERGDAAASLAGCQRAQAVAIQHGLRELAGDAATCAVDALIAADDVVKAAELAGPLAEQSEIELGPDHPHTLHALRLHASALLASGDAAGAQPLWDRVIAAYERQYGATSIELMYTLRDFANAASPGGAVSTPAALAAIERAVRIADQVLAAKDPRHAAMLETLAYVESALQHLDRAIVAYERAIRLYEQVDDPAALARVLYNAADALKETGKCERAVPLFRRAMKVAAETGLASVLGAASLYGMGACLGDARQWAEAEAALVQSIEQLDKAGEPLFAAQSRWELAAQRAIRGQRAKALATAREATAQLAGRPPPADALRAEIDAWIAKH